MAEGPAAEEEPRPKRAAKEAAKAAAAEQKRQQQAEKKAAAKAAREEKKAAAKAAAEAAKMQRLGRSWPPTLTADGEAAASAALDPRDAFEQAAGSDSEKLQEALKAYPAFLLRHCRDDPALWKTGGVVADRMPFGIQPPVVRRWEKQRWIE